MTKYQKLFLSEFHAWGGVCLKFHVHAGHYVGLLSRKDYQTDLLHIQQLKKNAFDTRNITVSLAIVAIQSACLN